MRRLLSLSTWFVSQVPTKLKLSLFREINSFVTYDLYDTNFLRKLRTFEFCLRKRVLCWCNLDHNEISHASLDADLRCQI